MALVSIIIPIYNSEKYLKQCLDSVKHQSLKDIEIICIDNGSEDNSVNIINDYQASDSRFKLIMLKEVMNTGLARNTGIDNASGEYIMFLDSDDWFEATACEDAYNQIKKNNNEIVFFNYKIYYEYDNKYKTCNYIDEIRDHINEPNIKLYNLDTVFMGSYHCMAIYKRDFLNKFDIRYSNTIQSEDTPFRLKAIFYSESVSILDKVLYSYRKQETKPKIRDYNELITYFDNIRLSYEHLINSPHKDGYMKLFMIKYIRQVLKRYHHFDEYNPDFEVKNLLFSQIHDVLVLFAKSYDVKNIKKYIKMKRYNKFYKYKDLYEYNNRYSISRIVRSIFVRDFNPNVKRLYYYSKVVNFGDQLNLLLFKYFDVEVIKGSKKNADIAAIGSILGQLTTKRFSLGKRVRKIFGHEIIIYGSGFIEKDEGRDHFIRKLDVRAVRGQLTLNRLKETNVVKISPNVILGDPGLLASKFVDTSNIEKKYDLGIIPHYVDKDNPLLKKIQVRNSIILDICSEPKDLIKKIAECRNIISSAMHGLIAADSLGIPNVRMILSDKIIGGDYKFNDYYSAFGLKEHERINLNERGFTDEDLPKIAENYKITHEMVEKIQQELIEAFPYKNMKKGTK